MAASELTWKATVDPAVAQAALRSVRTEIEQTTKASQTANQSELSMRQQLAAVASLQRQRSAALIADWKQQEREAANLAKGIKPLSENFQELFKIISSNAVLAETPIAGLTAEIGELAAQGGEALGVLGPVGLAIGAIAVASVGAGLALAELDKKAFEAAETFASYGQEIYKAQVTTGLAAEDLSLLRVVAEKTQTPFETLIHAASRLQVSISKGIAEPSSEAGRALKFLKLDSEEFNRSTPLEQLRQTAEAINRVQNQADKNHASQALLNRSYAESALALQTLATQYEETRDQAEKFGLLLSEEDVQAAHEFHETIERLTIGFEGLGVQIGQKTAPAIEAALQDIAKELGLNENSWRQWGDLIGDILAATVTATVRMAHDVETAIKNIPFLFAGPIGVAEYIRRLIAGDSEEAAKQMSTLLQGGASSGGDLGTDLFGRTGSRFPTKEPRASRGEKISAGQRLLNQLEDEYNRLLAKTNDLNKVDIVTMELLKHEYDDITPALRLRIEAEADMIKDLEEGEKVKKADAEQSKQDVQLAKQLIEVLQKRADARQKLEDQTSEAVERERAALQELQFGERTHLELVERYINKASEQAEAVGGVTDKMREYFALLIQVASKQDQIEAHNKLFEGVTAGAGGARRDRSSIDQLFQAVNENLTGAKQTAALAGLAALTDGFSQLGQAVGQTVEAWVLYGKAGESVRQVTAQILASVAQQAAVKAVFELAEGFAALALAYFGIPNAGPSASAHFIAAATYASIGAIAAVAGRGVAGAAFANATGAGTSARGTTGGTSGGTQGPTSITLESQRQPVMHIVVEHKGSPAFESKVVDAFVKNANGGGAARQLLVKEINRQQ